MTGRDDTSVLYLWGEGRDFLGRHSLRPQTEASIGRWFVSASLLPSQNKKSPNGGPSPKQAGFRWGWAAHLQWRKTILVAWPKTIQREGT